MQPPPSPTKCLHYPITTSVAILAIVATLRWWGGADIDRFLSDRGNCLMEPWRLLAPALFHGGILHLLFNICWLWAFGTFVEDEYGHGATLGIFSLLAVGSMAAELAVFRGGIGLSGVVYGLFGLLWVLGRTNPRFRTVVDHGVIELMCGWFFLCIVLTIADVWNIANVAHGVGCILGALLGWTISARGLSQRLWRSVILAAAFLLCVAGGTVGRSYVNLLNDAGPVLAEQGQRALEAGDPQRAVNYYEKAVDANQTVREWWTNLGHAYQQVGRRDDAAKALQRAADLEHHRSRSQ